MTQTNIFTVCWLAIMNVYDQISKMIIIEECKQSAKNLQEFPLLVWSLKRLFLGQYFCLMLLSDPSRSGRGAEAQKIIMPIIEGAIREEAKRRTAVAENRELVQAVSSSQITVGVDMVQSLQKSGVMEHMVLIFCPQRKAGEMVITTPGQPMSSSLSVDCLSGVLEHKRRA